MNFKHGYTTTPRSNNIRSIEKLGCPTCLQVCTYSGDAFRTGTLTAVRRGEQVSYYFLTFKVSHYPLP
jgi:hypothetical protein